MIRFFERREVLRPTGAGWASLLLLLLLGGALFFNSIYPFLNLNDPLESDVLVVEGWVDDDSIGKVLELFETGNYRYVVATGIPITHGAEILPYSNYADLTRMRLLAAGLSPGQALAAPAPDVRRNRTRAMAAALKRFLTRHPHETSAVNIFSEGAHARRSRDIYRDVLQPEFDVGVIAVTPAAYSADDWWQSSEGVKSVLSEALAYVYNSVFTFAVDRNMNIVSIYILGGLLGYLLGAIPFGFMIGKANGVDVRGLGSGNIGATNVFRTVGRNWGVLALTLDFLKGLAAAYLIPMLLLESFGAEEPYLIGLTCGCAAIIGHNYSVYLKMRGGKGIATSAGMLAGITPVPFAAGILIWAILFLTLRYVSLASIAAAATVALTGWLFNSDDGITLPIVLTAIAGLVILRHHANLKRLFAGDESKVEFGRRKSNE